MIKYQERGLLEIAETISNATEFYTHKKSVCKLCISYVRSF